MPTLREIRISRLLSMRDLAAKAEVGLSTLYMIEAGRSAPGLKAIRKLSKALGVEPTEVDEFREKMHQMATPRGKAA
ncbi:MAG: helix-turn-helix domain-containing protein, partial [Chloroflexi bacterium]|nr:helix-turn-helix domain-containing protein [Chloroflexota bacterium]